MQQASTTTGPIAGRLNRTRRFSYPILMVLVIVSLIFMGGEAIVRLFVGAPLAERLPLEMIQANRLRGWEMVPHTSHFTYTHEVKLNSLGLRGPEIPDRRPGDRIVLALGDSIVYGQGVSLEDTIPARLAKKLNQERADERSRYHVVNGGVRAYSTNQELGLLKEFADTIKPDVVVLYWFWNDVEETNIARSYNYLLHTGPIFFDLKAAMGNATLLRWYGRQALRQSALLVWTHHVLTGLTYRYPTTMEISAGMSNLEGYLAEFKELSLKYHFAFFMTIVPDAASILGPHHTENISERAKLAASRRGVPVIEVLDVLKNYYQTARKLPILAYDGHYNGAANNLIAERTAASVAPTSRTTN
jgi:lysophospholipase L1-like esterase